MDASPLNPWQRLPSSSSTCGGIVIVEAADTFFPAGGFLTGDFTAAVAFFAMGLAGFAAAGFVDLAMLMPSGAPARRPRRGAVGRRACIAGSWPRSRGRAIPGRP